MRAEEKNMVERIMNTETMGYAYEYPYGGGARKEYMLALTPENLANFIVSVFMIRSTIFFSSALIKSSLLFFNCQTQFSLPMANMHRHHSFPEGSEILRAAWMIWTACPGLQSKEHLPVLSGPLL